MSIDMYKTFIPIKRTTFSMVMAITELTARILGGGASGGSHLDSIRDFAVQKHSHYSRPAAVETMLDLLDLYVQHHKSTRLGTRFDLALFMDIKIQLNNDLERDALPRHTTPHCSRCEPTDPSTDPLNPADATPGGSATSPATATPASSSSAPRPPRGQEGTMRFVFDPEAARSERDTVGAYFREEFEEYEVEVDEPVPPPPQHPSSSRRDDEGGRGGRGGGRRHRDRGGWGGPYPGGGGGYRGDRHRGRGRLR